MRRYFKNIVYGGLILGCMGLTCFSAYAGEVQKDSPANLVAKATLHKKHEWELEAAELVLSHDKHHTIASLPFEDVLMELNQSIPYVSLDSVFKDLLSYKINCDEKYSCVITSIPPGYDVQINARTRKASIQINTKNTEKDTVEKFSKNDLFYKDDHIWIRYDVIKKLLPMEGHWDISNYIITYQTNMPIYSVLKKKRREHATLILRQQKEFLYKEERKKSAKAIKPGHHFGANLKYNLKHQESFSPDHLATNTGSFSVLSDLFGGTLRSNGSVDFSAIKDTDPSWTYTFMHKKHFHLLRFGDVNAESSLFMGNISLINGVQFDLNKSSDTSLSFRYENQAIPGTDIELWRGGFLVQTVAVGSDGRYTLYDANAEPGDIYRIKYFFPNGTEQIKTVQFSNDKNLLLSKGKWDLNASYGTPSSTSLNMGPVGAYLVRYGLTKNITTGFGHYDFNDIEDSKTQHMNYLDFAWQIMPYWNINAQHMLGNSDVAAQTAFNYFQKHYITAEYRQLNPSSDILKIPTVTGDYAATKQLVLEDRYTLPNGWRMVGMYDDTNIDRDMEVGLQARVSSLYSIDAAVGHYQDNNPGSSSLSIKLNNTFRFNQNHQIKANLFWSRASKDTENLSYTYRNNYNNHFTLNYSLNVMHTGSDGKIDPSASFGWNMGQHWSMSANAGIGQFSISLSYLGAWSSFNGFSAVKEYGRGSLKGAIIAPGGSQPLAGITVSAGGQTTTTDEEGRYQLNNLPTYVKIPIKVEPDKAGLPYINSRKLEYIWLRPHTQIDHDFHLSELVGIDGYVVTHDDLSADIMVQATAIKTGDAWEAPVSEQDGFYAFEGLPEGTYQLTVEGMKNPPLPKVVTITTEEQWLSDVELFVPGYHEEVIKDDGE